MSVKLWNDGINYFCCSFWSGWSVIGGPLYCCQTRCSPSIWITSNYTLFGSALSLAVAKYECGITGVTLKQPSQLHRYPECDWLFLADVKPLSWEASPTRHMWSSGFISVWLPLSACSETKIPRRWEDWCNRMSLHLLPSPTAPLTLSRDKLCAVRLSLHRQSTGNEVSALGYHRGGLSWPRTRSLVRTSEPAPHGECRSASRFTPPCGVGVCVCVRDGNEFSDLELKNNTPRPHPHKITDWNCIFNAKTRMSLCCYLRCNCCDNKKVWTFLCSCRQVQEQRNATLKYAVPQRCSRQNKVRRMTWFNLVGLRSGDKRA